MIESVRARLTLWYVSILAAILMSLSIRWESTSLFNTLVMFALLAAGLGTIARSLRPYPAS